MAKSPEDQSFKLSPGRRVLFITKDLSLIARQLSGELDLLMHDLSVDDLLDDINTDVMTPAWVCFNYDPAEIAREAYAGLLYEGRRIFARDALRDGNFEVIVSGWRKGVGSSRETATQAEKWCGIRLVVAASFAPIHAANNLNQGQLMGNHEQLRSLQAGKSLSFSELGGHESPSAALLIESGGLFSLTRAFDSGTLTLPSLVASNRAMNMAEKILQRHVVDPGRPDSVAPGDLLRVSVDAGYSHEYTTAQVHTFLQHEFGADYAIRSPQKFAVFEDHLIYADEVPRMKQFADSIATLRSKQREFQVHTGCLDYSAVNGVSPGICHQVAREQIVSPGDFVLATDSHTCMGGVNNALAWGVGATEYAALLHSGWTLLEVPESVRFVLTGTFKPGVTAKDLMLQILATFTRDGTTINRVIEFGGEGVSSLSLDERATLANMATECGARGAILEADEALFEWLSKRRGSAHSSLWRESSVHPDAGARYAGGVHEIRLSEIEPMLASPGDPEHGIPSDPTNGLPVSEAGHVAIDIAYAGSCTAGKIDDLRFYHQVCSEAVSAGKRVAEGVRFFIQFGSVEVERYCREEGLLETFAKAGATLLSPGCGACIGCGPGISDRSDQVTISAINRNYSGRSGPGRLWLASPLTVAASAFTGFIAAYREGMFLSGAQAILPVGPQS